MNWRRQLFAGALPLLPAHIAFILLALLGCSGRGIERPPLADAGVAGAVSYPGGLLAVDLVSGAAPDGLFSVDPFHGVRPGVDIPTAEMRLGINSVRGSTRAAPYQSPLPDTLLQFRDLGTDNWVWESLPTAPGIPLASFFRYRLSSRLVLSSYHTILLHGEYEVIIEQRKGRVTRAIAF